MKKLILLCLIILAGCIGGGEPGGEPRAVVEAWIDNGSHPVVLFTSTVTPDPEGGSVEDAVLRWGRVTVSDGRTEIVMTGVRDNRYIPPYKYTTTEITGQPGKTYRITATFKDLKAEAESAILEPTPIDSIVFSDCGVDSLRATTLYFTAPADVPAYYYISVMAYPQTMAPRPGLMGWGECAVPGRSVAMAVYTSKPLDPDRSAQLQVGRYYTVFLHRVSLQVYEFWRAYDNALMFGGNVLFGTNTSLPTNIIGGYGVFSARATTSETFLVK